MLNGELQDAISNQIELCGFLRLLFYFILNKISWANCFGFCTDGAKSISGLYIGLRGGVLKSSNKVLSRRIEFVLKMR